MMVTIDGAGRIVVPKALRDELGLKPGTSLLLAVRDGGLVIEPAPTAMRLVRRGRGVIAAPDEPLPPLSAGDVRAVLESTRR